MPVTFKDVTKTNFTLNYEVGNSAFLKAMFNATCDPNIKSGFSTFEVFRSQDKYSISVASTLNLQVSVTLVQFTIDLKGVTITDSKYNIQTQSINFTAEVEAVGADISNFTVYYILGLTTINIDATVA
jgi:hypothetical protein